MLTANAPTSTRKAVPIFGLGQQARSPFLSSVTRINAMIESNENGRQQVAILGMPGLSTVTTIGPTPARGIFVREGEAIFYMVIAHEVYKVTPGAYRKIGDLATASGPVWMDENGVQLFINDGLSPYIYTFASEAFDPITDGDYPSGARGGVYLDGRFWVYVVSGQNKGRVYASDIKDGKSWDGLNFFEPSASPDSIIAVVRYASDLLIIGSGSVEWWGAVPSSIPGALGFQPSATANTEIGGVSELGHAKSGQSVFFVGHEGGDIGIYRVNGYTIEPVDDPGVSDSLTPSVASSTICTSYSVDGHSFFQVTAPSTNYDVASTWVYDGHSGQWSKRESDGLPYYRGLFAVSSGGATYVSDAFTGRLSRMDEGIYTENGGILPFEVTSQHLLKEGDHITMHGIQIDMENGVGNAVEPGSNPHLILSVSKDGGRTWPIVRHVSIGRAGQYLKRVRAMQFGAGHDIAVRIRITDPIPRHVTGAYLEMEPNYA